MVRVCREKVVHGIEHQLICMIYSALAKYTNRTEPYLKMRKKTKGFAPVNGDLGRVPTK